MAQARQGDLAGAAATNQRLLELMPGNVAALRNLAILARDQGKPDEAMQWLNQALPSAAQNPAELKSALPAGGRTVPGAGRHGAGHRPV